MVSAESQVPAGGIAALPATPGAAHAVWRAGHLKLQKNKAFRLVLPEFRVVQAGRRRRH